MRFNIYIADIAVLEQGCQSSGLEGCGPDGSSVPPGRNQGKLGPRQKSFPPGGSADPGGLRPP